MGHRKSSTKGKNYTNRHAIKKKLKEWPKHMFWIPGKRKINPQTGRGKEIIKTIIEIKI